MTAVVHRLRTALIGAALCCSVCCSLAAAPAVGQATQGDVDRLREALSTSEDIEDAERETLTQDLASAEELLEKAAQERSQQQLLRETLENGEQRVSEYQSKMLDIEDAPQTLRARLGENPTLADLEAEIGIIETQRESWTDDRSEALDAMANVAADSAAARDRLAEVNALLAETQPVQFSEELPLDERIQVLEGQAERAALTAEAERLQLRLRAESIINNIRTARVNWLDAAIAEADALLSELRAAAANQRQSAAMQRGAETRRLLEGLVSVRPQLQTLADENLTLIDRQQELAEDIENARRALANTRDIRERTEQDANLTRRRLEVAGLEAGLGEVMLSRLASLPATSRVEQDIRNRNEHIADISIRSIDTEQALRERADRAEYLAGVIQEPDTWRQPERRVALQLYEQQRELLRDNQQAQSTLLRLLVDANQASDELLLTVNAYRDFLTGNLLWTRNYAFLSPPRFREQILQLTEAFRIADPAALPLKLARNAPLTLLFAALLVLGTQRRKVRRKLNDMLGQPIRTSNESPSMLFTALVLTVLKALPGPLLLAVLGQALRVLDPSNTAQQAIGEALLASALTLFGLNFLRALGARLGAGRRLLKWNSAKVDALMRGMHWIAPLLALAVGFGTLGRRLTPTDSGGPIGAAASLSIALLLLCAAIRVLRSGQFDSDRFARFSLRFLIVASAAITVLHLTGQLFAAHMYLWALGASLAAVLVTLLLVSTLQRILQLYRYRLQQRAREAQRERENDADGLTEQDEAAGASDAEALASLSDAHQQLLSLLRLLTLGSLLWLIWSPALPALSVLDEITLWSTTDSTLPEGELRAVSLGVLLQALLTLAITALITRQLPPLVNVLLLEWGKVSAGGRYATGMLLQYLIIGVGLSIAFSLLGFEWGKVQWLVAALGVGIGFGLQEIVANFISGLIVLFERPIRVGDIIHAGGNEGVVSRINPRATVIETFDGKEVMVPNKELITNVVTNWSLSSTKLRLVVPVGIAYGSDVVEAMRILVAVAKENSAVLEEPAPIVTFEDFGDNALTLWLRCFTDREYPVIASRLRVAIYEAYEKAGISIAFPQRDVHLDASAPIPVRMVGDSDPA